MNSNNQNALCNIAVNNKIIQILHVNLYDDKNFDYKDVNDLVNSISTESGDTIYHLIIKKETFTEKQVIKILEMVLDLQVNPNATNVKGQTPLHLAIDKEYKNVIELLLKNGADINFCDQEGNSIAHFLITNLWKKFKHFPCNVKIKSFATLNQHLTTMTNFIDWLVSIGLIIDYKTENEISPIHLAMNLRFYWILPTLLKYLNNPTYTMKDDENLLHLFFDELSYHYDWMSIHTKRRYNLNKNVFASEFYAGETLRMLVFKGVSVNQVNNYGDTPFHYAAERQKTDTIKLMLQTFTNVDSCNKFSRNTVLHIICKTHFADDKTFEETSSLYAEFVRTLISKGANINVVDIYGYTPVQYAVMGVHLPIIKVFKDHGADFQEVHEQYGNLLHVLGGTTSGRVDTKMIQEVAEFLIQEGCKINGRDAQGMTPLHVTSQTWNFTLTQCLLENGANIHSRELSENRYTSLHLAVNYTVFGNEKMIELLIKAGANVNAKDSHGRTPLHIASIIGNKIIAHLLKSGACIHLRDDEGLTPLQLAIKYLNSDSIFTLIRYGANINDPGIIRPIGHVAVNERKWILRFILNKWYKLKIVGLPAMKEYEEFESEFKDPDNIKSKCLEELKVLKKHLIDDHVSVYDFLHMNLKASSSYLRKENVQNFFKLKDIYQTFPNYCDVIMMTYGQSIERRSLLKSAKSAWFKLTNIYLPDILVEMIISHLENWDLISMAEADKEYSCRILMDHAKSNNFKNDIM